MPQERTAVKQGVSHEISLPEINGMNDIENFRKSPLEPHVA
jgi:hypothetical protein